jgi:hypothetical protein
MHGPGILMRTEESAIASFRTPLQTLYCNQNLLILRVPSDLGLRRSTSTCLSYNLMSCSLDWLLLCLAVSYPGSSNVCSTSRSRAHRRVYAGVLCSVKRAYGCRNVCMCTYELHLRDGLSDCTCGRSQVYEVPLIIFPPPCLLLGVWPVSECGQCCV